MFIIEDESHAECIGGEYGTLKDAVLELHRLSKIPWDEEPNRAPCTSWKKCGRRYQIIEYDNSTEPWQEISRRRGLEIRASGLKWNPELENL